MLTDTVQAAEDDAQGQESDDEVTNESKLNTLKKQLEDCRSELFDVYDQVRIQPIGLDSRFGGT